MVVLFAATGLVVGAVVALTLQSWWVFAVVVALHTAATVAVVRYALRQTTAAGDKPDPVTRRASKRSGWGSVDERRRQAGVSDVRLAYADGEDEVKRSTQASKRCREVGAIGSSRHTRWSSALCASRTWRSRRSGSRAAGRLSTSLTAASWLTYSSGTAPRRNNHERRLRQRLDALGRSHSPLTRTKAAITGAAASFLARAPGPTRPPVTAARLSPRAHRDRRLRGNGAPRGACRRPRDRRGGPSNHDDERQMAQLRAERWDGVLDVTLAAASGGAR